MKTKKNRSSYYVLKGHAPKNIILNKTLIEDHVISFFLSIVVSNFIANHFGHMCVCVFGGNAHYLRIDMGTGNGYSYQIAINVYIYICLDNWLKNLIIMFIIFILYFCGLTNTYDVHYI